MNTTGKVYENCFSEAVSELDQKYFPEPWSLDQWQRINWHHHLLLTLGEENLQGFALFGYLPGDDTAHLYKILVHPEHQKTGLAQAFWSEILTRLRDKGITQIYLEVNSLNQRAIGFYLKVGFKQIRKNSGYYSNGEDALIMTLTL